MSKNKKLIKSLPLLDGKSRVFTAKVTRDAVTEKKDFIFGPGHKSIPNGNVDCIHTGNGLTVVDVDDKNSEEKINPKLRKLLPKSPTVKTYNGDHYYFINADWLKQTQGLTELVDVRNAQGTGLVACNYTGNDETISYKVASGVIYDLDDPKYKKLKKMLTRLQEAHQVTRISLIEKSFVDGEPWKCAGDGKHHDFLQDMAILSVRAGKDDKYIWSRYEEYYESYLLPRNKKREDAKMESRINWALGHIKPRTELKGKRLTGDTLTDEIKSIVKGVTDERSSTEMVNVMLDTELTDEIDNLIHDPDVEYDTIVERISHIQNHIKLKEYSQLLSESDKTTKETTGSVIKQEANRLRTLRERAEKEDPKFLTKKGKLFVCKTYKAGGVRMVFFKGNNIKKYGEDEAFLINKESGFDMLRSQGMLESCKVEDEKMYLAELDTVNIIINPFMERGWHDGIFNMLDKKPVKMSKTPVKMSKVLRQALKVFRNDVKWKGIPFSIIVVAYQMHHNKYIMPTLAIIGPQACGKSMYTYDIFVWYHGSTVSLIGASSKVAEWGDLKKDKRHVCYNDVSRMKGSTAESFKETIKNESTEGSAQVHNIKGGAIVQAKYGSNRSITSNATIPLETEGNETDRRVYISDYNIEGVDGVALARAYGSGTVLNDEQTSNRAHMVQYFYDVYRMCERETDDELREWLNVRVPESNMKSAHTRGQLADGRAFISEMNGAKDDELNDIFSQYFGTDTKKAVKLYKEKRSDEGNSWFLDVEALVELRYLMTVVDRDDVVNGADVAKAFLGIDKRALNPQRTKNGRIRGIKISQK